MARRTSATSGGRIFGCENRAGFSLQLACHSLAPQSVCARMLSICFLPHVIECIFFQSAFVCCEKQRCERTLESPACLLLLRPRYDAGLHIRNVQSSTGREKKEELNV